LKNFPIFANVFACTTDSVFVTDSTLLTFYRWLELN
jgi:hypothetical protein